MQENGDPVMSNRSWWSRFREHRPALWSLRILYVLVFVAVFADFIANERPLYCKVDKTHYFPVFRQVLSDFGWVSFPAELQHADWHQLDYAAVVFPPIPYSASTQDIRNRGLVGPFDRQQVDGWRWRHWLGTDQLGRDVAAGMISGTRIALLVGLVAMAIATFIGLLLGAMAGYFGDRGLRMRRVQLAVLTAGILFAAWYAFLFREPAHILARSSGGSAVWGTLGGVLLIIGSAIVLSWRAGRWIPGDKRISLPLDLLVMRLIEIMRSIPGLLLLLAIVSIIEKPSILYVMAIIGLIRWTSIAQFLRAEFLKVREATYIQAARVLGLPDSRIILLHALPNAIYPVLITIAFGFASAILLEAFLSFLGIGLAAEEVTWGGLLSNARQHFSAWWLAVFPGLAIFITVTVFNLIGDGLREAMDVGQSVQIDRNGQD